MPVVINEVEILDAPQPAAPTGATGPGAARHSEPAHEQLRRLSRDLAERQRRLWAD